MANKAQADPLNRHAAKGGWGGPLSALRLPAAPGHRGLGGARRCRGTAAGATLAQRGWGGKRDVWLHRSGRLPPPPMPCRYRRRRAAAGDLLDGHYWARHMSVFGPLDAMTARGELPPALYLLVDALDPATRAMEMLPCQADFGWPCREELLPQLRAVQPFSERPGDTLVAGQSFNGGLAALYADAALAGALPGMVLSQSGSFWWGAARRELAALAPPERGREWRRERRRLCARRQQRPWALEAGCGSSWRPAATRQTWRPRAAPCRRRCDAPDTLRTTPNFAAGTTGCAGATVCWPAWTNY